MKQRSNSLNLEGFFFQVGVFFLFFFLCLVLPLKDLFSFCGSTSFPLGSMYISDHDVYLRVGFIISLPNP